MRSDPVFDMKPEVEAWAEAVVEEWRKKVDALNIVGKGDLRKSFDKEVHWHAGGDIQKIDFMFEYYGRFVDWGVGNGVNLDNREAMISAGRTIRRPRKWYTSTFYKEVANLRRKISERTGQHITLILLNGIEQKQE